MDRSTVQRRNEDYCATFLQYQSRFNGIGICNEVTRMTGANMAGMMGVDPEVSRLATTMTVRPCHIPIANQVL